MPEPSVTVVIPTYNYGRYISEAIYSVLQQTQAVDEIVVVDDGSTDDTGAVVATFGEKIIYVRQQNLGVCAARNRGVEESSGELIAFLDADDTWLPEKIEKQIACFQQHEEVGLVHCGIREFDGETGAELAIRLDGAEGQIAENLLLWEGPSIIGPGGTIVVSRKAFDEAGGFDPRLKVGEDWDFCYRVARKFRVAFVREPLVNYRSHRHNAHKNVAEMERGMSLFYEKAFADGDANILSLRSRSYGNYHRVLAGSYFYTRDYWQFLRHSLKSIWRRPGNIWYFLSFPLRRFSGRSS